jgi:tetratricopeptide (TPR) repeat protein
MDENDNERAIHYFSAALDRHYQNKKETNLMISDDIDESNTINQLGNVYFNLNQLEKAIEMFEKGLNLSPANMALRSNLGSLYRHINRNDLARNVLETGLKLCNFDYISENVSTQQNRTSGIKIQPPAALLNNLGDKFTYIYVNVYVYMYIYIYMHVCIYICISMYVYALISNSIYVGLLELDEHNYQIALNLFEAAIEINNKQVLNEDMRSSDGTNAADVIMTNVNRAREGLRKKG